MIDLPDLEGDLLALVCRHRYLLPLLRSRVVGQPA